MMDSSATLDKTAALEEFEAKSKATDRILLLKAKEDAKKRVRDDPSSANIAALEKITALLERTEAKSQPSQGKPFKSVAEVLNYAQGRGHKLKRSKLFNDVKAGKLPRQADGCFLQADVERYLSTISFAATPDSLVDEAWQRQQEKDLQEIRYKRAMADREEFALAVKKGQYLPKEIVWQELAARAAVLQSGLKTAFEARCLEIIDVCAGEHKSANRLSEFLVNILDDALNIYASKAEFEADLEEADSGEI